MQEVRDIGLFYDEDEAMTLKKMGGSSSYEVLVSSLNQIGEVNLSAMSEASGKSKAELILDLRGSAIFQDPAEFEWDESWSMDKGWKVCWQYCSGNLRKKLKLAKRMNKRFPGCFQCNVKVLERLIDDPLQAPMIYASLGASWIPAEIYAQYIKETLRLKEMPKVNFIEKINFWQVMEPESAKASVLNTMTYGIPRLHAIKIIEQTMNAKTVKVPDYVPSHGWNYKPLLNKEQTLEAQERQDEIIRQFKQWSYDDEFRRALLEERYNDFFAGYRAATYDGSFLELPDINPKITLYDHQRNSIARFIFSEGNLLLAQDVGTGKTYIMFAGIHERYRMGLSRKNLMVVPKSILQETIDSYRDLYPNDKILPIYPKDFSPQYRKETLEKIRDGDEVVVIMGFPSFDRIGMSKEYWIKKFTREIKSLQRAIDQCDSPEEKHLLNRKMKSLNKELSKRMEMVDPPWLTFDQLGIETLVIDEAHYYKNLPLHTRADNIVGLHSAGAQKCVELLEKVKVVKKVLMATGTPISNSLADLFAFQTYLQPEELKFRGIDSFDMWINTFAERETNMEVDVDGEHLRAVTRFSKFHNLSEMMALFSTVCDFYHLKKDDEKLPQFDGYRDIMVQRSAAQEEYIKSLGERTELIRARKVSRTEDNLLKVTVDGRKCALEENKVRACAKNVFSLAEEYPQTSQIVFCDIGTPKEGFNIYDSLKEELMLLGMPEEEIAFIHDAKTESARKRLFAAVNEGIIRVVIASTAKMGVGVNVQKRLIGIHHLSVPWRPADMVQREGRIFRQGNECEKVYVYRYITAGSFDSYSWQLLESKQRFVSNVLAATWTERDAEDVADTVLNYAELKALAIGNPLIKTRVETANQLERARHHCSKRQTQLLRLRAKVEEAPALIEKWEKLHRIALKDVELYQENKHPIPLRERLAFGEELLEALEGNHMQEQERLFDCYRGFDVYLPANMDGAHPHIYLRSVHGGSYPLKLDTDKSLGCAMRVDHLLEGLPDRVRQFEENIELAHRQKEEAQADFEKGNKYEALVESLERELSIIDQQLEAAS